MSLDLNGEAVNDCAELAPQPVVSIFGDEVVDGPVSTFGDEVLDGFAATQISFDRTLVHFSVVPRNLTVKPDFVQLPPGVVAASVSKADTPRSAVAIIRKIETLITLKLTLVIRQKLP